jgi:hypothetical protein
MRTVKSHPRFAARNLTQRRKDAKEDGENGSQTIARRLLTRIGRPFFFAPSRLRAFALKFSMLWEKFALWIGPVIANAAFERNL